MNKLLKNSIPLVLITIFTVSLNLVAVDNTKSKNAEKYKRILEYDWGKNAEIIVHPVYGVIVLSKDRWQNWVMRSSIIIMVYISIMAVLLGLPKNAEIYLIVSYILCGAAFIISFWETLSGWMLTRLESYKYGWMFILISIPMYVFSYIITMKIKKYDISYAEIKEEFKKMQKLKVEQYQDPRLLPVSGLPGDWEDEDFIRG